MDNSLEWIIGIATALLAVGLWLMAPRPGSRGLWSGLVITLVGLLFLIKSVPGLGELGPSFVFYLLAAATVLPAIATVTCSSPMYAAIWFAMTLLGSAGLLLYQGAQFLGVATVVVYAGAILVTFLFVLMLAQPGGKASYDRISWEAPLSATAGAVMVGLLTLAIANVFQHDVEAARPAPQADEAALDKGILNPEQMALLGGQLFSRHLISVELAGTLLLVGLVGCVAIVMQTHKGRAPKSSGVARSVTEIVTGMSVTHVGMSGPSGGPGAGGGGHV
jgi:NADH-quinone oxidoreductase subunit J